MVLAGLTDCTPVQVAVVVSYKHSVLVGFCGRKPVTTARNMGFLENLGHQFYIFFLNAASFIFGFFSYINICFNTK